MQIVSQQLDYDRGLREYIQEATKGWSPKLGEFALHNRTMLNLVRHLRRHTTGSKATARIYIYAVYKYSQWLQRTPDQILFDCYGPEGEPLPKMLLKHTELIDDFVGYLKDQDLAPGTAALYAAGVKALYNQNKLPLSLPRYPRTLQHPNRSPTPAELEQVLDVCDVRERVIISFPALTGVRLGTLCQLTYGDLRSELEEGKIPLKLALRPAITKGQAYGAPSWTFLSAEGIGYLKAYFETRRRGTERTPPEIIDDNAPLIRDAATSEVRPITPDAAWRIINNLYRRAGLIRDPTPRRDVSKPEPYKSRKRFDLRPHSLRYYFRSQITSLGCPSEYAEFMLQHKTALYNDIRMKGPEFLREIYRRCNLSIRQKPRGSKLEEAKTVLRALGIDPEKALVKEAFSEPHRVNVEPEERDLDDVYSMIRRQLAAIASNPTAVNSTRD